MTNNTKKYIYYNMSNRFSVFNSDPDERSIDDVYSDITKKTRTTLIVWKNYIEQEKLQKNKIMLDWQVSLTDSLEYWISLGDNISTGDLILARINIGILIETWLKIFFTIYSYDYASDESDIIRNYKKKKVGIKKLSLNGSIQFFTSKIDPVLFYQKCPTQEDLCRLIGEKETTDLLQYRENEIKCYKSFIEWLNRIRNTRNSVHSFTYREIGTYHDFIKDTIKFNAFLDIIMQQLPDVN